MLVGTLLVCILVPLSIRYVSPYEYAFVRDRFGTINTDKVLGPGEWYFYPLQFSLVYFPSVAKEVSFNDNPVSIFTRDGLQVRLHFSFNFQFRKDNLKTVYNKYGVNYLPVILSQAQLTVKNFGGSVGSSRTLTELLKQRETVESELATFFRQQMLSIVGVDTPIEYFKIGHISIPSTSISQYLATVIQVENATVVKNLQDLAAIRAETGTILASLRANETTVKVTAEINANLVIGNSEGTAQGIILTARAKGIQHFFSVLNITNSSIKLQIIETFGVMDNPNASVLSGLGSSIVNLQK
ncbi:MAG: hypothetical protein EBQ92_01020 [Proteobacteria bacterium]|nr:hypothetical protein [Pseudomonadota bacterium]